MKNNSPDRYEREDERAHEFWFTALFIAGLFVAFFYLLITTLSPNVLILLGVALIILVSLYPRLESKRIGYFLHFFGSFLFAMGIACIWAGYLKGLPK